MKKCIILHTANYSSKIKNYFCVDELIKNGVDVEFWNVGPITVNEHLAEEFSQGLVVRTINNKQEYVELIKRNDDALYFLYINYAWYSLYIYRILSKYDRKIVYCTSGCLPLSDKNKRSLIKLIRLRPRQIIHRLFSILLQLYLKTPLFNPSDFILKSCNIATTDYKISYNTIWIGINSSDYQGYKKLNNVNTPNDRYIVYIDQYLPFHNDFLIHGISHIDYLRFFSALNNLFNELEKKYDCRVVIAAHPSSTLYKETNYFYGREIIYGKTCELIKNCIGAISCNSTAISFPVLDYKPILLYTSNEIKEKYFNIHPEYFSDALGLEVVNIDNYGECSFSSINKDKYDEYRHAYLTTSVSENTNNSDIIISLLNSNYTKYQYYE